MASISSGRSAQGSYGYSKSEAEGGQYYTPESQARINALYPQMLSRWQQMPSPTSDTWNQLFGTVGGERTDFGNGPGLYMGKPQTYSPITVGDIWTPQQIDARVNAAKASNTAKTAGVQRQAAQQAAGRGFGANSPWAAAIQSYLAAQNLATNTGAENDLRWTSSQGNAAHRLATEQANLARSQAVSQDEFNRRTAADEATLRRAQLKSQDDIARRQVATQALNVAMSAAAQREGSLLAALNQINQPLSKNKSKSESWNQSSGWSQNYGQSAGPGDYY